MTPSDWPFVSHIYEEGIRTGIATFETEVPPYEEWDKSKLPFGRLVFENDKGQVVGWTALSAASDRCVYGGVAEVMVYVSEKARGMGVGSKLLEALVKESEDNGIWTLQAGIFTENEASIYIHRKAGFRIIGTREKLGKMADTWHDVLLLEKRSGKFQD